MGNNMSFAAKQALAFVRAWYMTDNNPRAIHTTANPLNLNGISARPYSNGLSELVAAGFLVIARSDGEAYLLPSEEKF